MNVHSYVRPFMCKAVIILNTVIIINNDLYANMLSIALSLSIQLSKYRITVLPYYAL